MKVMPKYYLPSCFLLFVTIISALILSNPVTYAVDYSDDVSKIDNVSIGVPVSCNLTGTNTDHTATISNGTYQSDIGTTTLKVSCNDAEGFAIYAIGYTDETEGKNVLTSPVVGSTYDIVTGTATSGNTSNWAMKLATITSPTPPYPITIENNFNNFHTVPDDYTLVAKRTSSTDIGQNAEGSTLTSTYQAYISPNQPANTYVGKVKYILVHPNNTSAPVKENQTVVIYDGNGSTFPGGASTNKITYEFTCEDEFAYVGDNYQEVMTSNILSGGEQDGAYASDEFVFQPITITGADRIKVDVVYNFYYSMIAIIEGELDGDTIPENYIQIGDDSNNYSTSGSDTYLFDGDTVTVVFQNASGIVPPTGQDYGFYAKIYPIYDEPTSGATYGAVETVCQTSTIGTYAEPVWYDYWYTEINGDEYTFQNNNEVTDFMLEHKEDLMGTSITLYSYNPYAILYDGNNATAGTMNGYYSDLGNDLPIGGTTTLIAPNFKKTGYGFAGWSTNSNATVNGIDTIYGPNEDVSINELTFGSDKKLTLYAVWVPSTGTMQNWSGCSSMSNGQVVALTDNRDNNVYTIGKLADGNCWMMENLRLDNTASTLSSVNTNNPASGFTTLAATSDNWPQTENQPNTINQSKLNTNNTNIGGANSFGVTLTTTPYETRNKYAQWYSYGNVYNWYSATAGNGTYSLTYGNNTAGDICPAGWSLPSLNKTPDQFAGLDLALGGSGTDSSESDSAKRWREFPQNFVYSGGTVTGSSNDGAGISYGIYWSNTSSGNSSAYGFTIEEENEIRLSFHFSHWKTTGGVIRCLTP